MAALNGCHLVASSPPARKGALLAPLLLHNTAGRSSRDHQDTASLDAIRADSGRLAVKPKHGTFKQLVNIPIHAFRRA